MGSARCVHVLTAFIGTLHATLSKADSESRDHGPIRTRNLPGSGPSTEKRFERQTVANPFPSRPQSKGALQPASARVVVEVEDSRRAQILEFIKANPGSHLRRIKRELNLAMGVLQYHLYRLEKEQVIVSHRRGLYKRFYARLDFELEEQEILGVLSQETERDLLLYLLKIPDATQKELSEFAHISAASTSWHMKRLIQTDLVEARHHGGFVYYIVKGDPAKIVKLLKRYQPGIWERWADRLADLLE
jgi:DNA-binding MarR family transcriptional regulator